MQRSKDVIAWRAADNNRHADVTAPSQARPLIQDQMAAIIREEEEDITQAVDIAGGPSFNSIFKTITSSVLALPSFHLQDGQSRTVRQFQFTDWPEQGVPKSGEGFIDFIGQVHKTKEQFGQDGPIAVHCR